MIALLNENKVVKYRRNALLREALFVWTSSEIRKTFLDYFASFQHEIVDSSSLVPIDDPTLLFANAGMNQFKNTFIGIEKRPYVRAATSQKCVRAGGKHNDLDTVGKTARHHTFFEMLGNFSFGDYFKPDAITLAWNFLTEKIGLPKERIWITIYQDDDEAKELWLKNSDVPENRIVRLGEKDNFWSMGETGPCGPCSEILFDRGPEFSCGDQCGIGLCECDRYLEIWNLVFMQYDKNSDGELIPLPRPSIDTGMGLERLASILQDVPTNFDTDLFKPIIASIEKMTGKVYKSGEEGFPFRVIADHSRACTFLIADGVLPSNEGRGYVLRRILRRAVRFGKILGLNEPFLYKNVAVVSNIMQDAYPYLIERQSFVEQVIKLEEERFFVTLNEGMKKLEEIIARSLAKDNKTIEASDAFMLYDTYGFPLDLTEDAALENSLLVDKDGFTSLMEEQRERGRKAREMDSYLGSELGIINNLEGIPDTVFAGYENIKTTAGVKAILIVDDRVDSAADTSCILVTDRTVFYAESGGQIADQGRIETKTGKFTVKDVRKVSKWYLHSGELTGNIKVGDTVEMAVDSQLRLDTERNHTATHLLHRALQTVVGSHAQQKGSLVEPGRLRFDFAHLAPLNKDEQEEIEKRVNAAIWDNYAIMTKEMSLKDAKQIGAEALFGEKYGEHVRVVIIGEYSKELCGGTHVLNTGQIGIFKIVSEGSIGSGLRRIEAITGRAALDYVNQNEEDLKNAAGILRITPREVPKRIMALTAALKEKDKEIEQLQDKMNSAAQQDLTSAAQNIGGAAVLIEAVSATDANSLRLSAERIKDKFPSAVVILAAPINDKVAIVCFVSKDLIAKGLHAGELVSSIAKITGGGGGGRPDMAQAGGKDQTKIAEALEQAKRIIENLLS